MKRAHDEKGAFFHDRVEVFLGDGIFNSDGQAWQKQRKIASHMFTSRRLKEDMSAVCSKNAKSVIARIKRHAADQRPLDIQDLFFRYTLESFAEIAFGETVGQSKPARSQLA